MYRETVEHPASLPPLIRQHLDLTSGNDRGRIYRIVPKGFVAPDRQLPGEASTQQLVAMLEHANGWHRATAARLLLERWSAEAAVLLRAKGLGAKIPEARIRAMYLLAEFGELPQESLWHLLDDAAPYVRLHAAALSIGECVDAESAARVAAALVALARSDGDSEWMRIAIASSAVGCRAAVLEQLMDESTGGSFHGGAAQGRIIDCRCCNGVAVFVSRRAGRSLAPALGHRTRTTDRSDPTCFRRRGRL
jgi:hypothetical protein